MGLGEEGGGGGEEVAVGSRETADEASLEPYGLDASRAPALLRHRTVDTRSFRPCSYFLVYTILSTERAHGVNTFYSDLARLIETWATAREARITRKK